MIFCSKCGAENQDGAQFCEQCGAPIFGDKPLEASINERKEEPSMQEQMPDRAVFEEPVGGMQVQQQNFTPYQSTPVVQPITAKCRTFGIIGFILGVSSLAFCWLGIFPAVGIIAGVILLACAIVGLVFCGISKREGSFKLARIGKVFAIIGLILSALCLIIGIILTIVAAQNGAFSA